MIRAFLSVRFWRDFRRQYLVDRAKRQARAEEARRWNAAGRPTGPGCDQTWRDLP